MATDPLLFTFFLIFTSAAVLATIALYTRQPMIITYIAAGILLGPSVTGLVSDPTIISNVSTIGIIFLLFLLGLDMQPSKLANMLGNALLVGLCSSLAFFGLGFAVGFVFGYTIIESTIIGVAMMFSSTIIGIKLLPTTVLHHRRTGELVVSLLLIQDFLAITVLLVLTGGFVEDFSGIARFGKVVLGLPLLIVFAWLFVKYVLLKILTKFDAFHEYIFLVAIGWCLGLSELATFIGLSHEIGAFIAGVSVATSPISIYIATNLKPLRDFFLVLFFFSLGAGFQVGLLGEIFIPAIIMAALVLLLKPIVFHGLLRSLSETDTNSWEIGFRLGQISEFSLLIAFIASAGHLIGEHASHLIQATAILTFLLSSYIVVFRYPTPIGVSEKLRRD
ncbi:cation:proton antiporter [Pseudomonadales bacterium]|jgi:Kef-type K+ transport system membrane component KefB|nr:cation:proton antiporter [Gammaproteobacteria bacterium]MBT7538237.1 cation:proton antiporter [Gammaproteobacteria bacterium]MDA7772260.1 cation:proton antiporter [Pseudomonadales bacterium]MDC1018725.1 cation:proton antiporter [Pseudomonadales bacterium]|tara:strand:- start:1099 stop:2271 length:1173 start_codon:yes stop_codon:yes gene_type:complete